MASDHVVHVVILAQVQLQQIDFHFTMLHKHAMLDHLRKTGGGKKNTNSDLALMDSNMHKV